MLMVKRLVTIDEIFTILYAFFQARNEVFGRAIFIEIFESVHEIRMLREVQVFACFTLVTHLAICTIFEGADEGYHLFMTSAYDVLRHMQILVVNYNSIQND